MKKLISILLSLIFLISILSACTDGGSESSVASEQMSEVSHNESSEAVSDDVTSDVSDEKSDDTSADKEIVIPPRENRLLLGDTNDINLQPYSNEISRGESTKFVDEDLVGDEINIKFGIEVKLVYERSGKGDQYDYTIHSYDGEGCAAMINAETGEFINLFFGGVNTHGQKTVKFDEIVEIATDFVEKFYPNRFDTGALDAKYDEKTRRYEFKYNNYSDKRDDVITETLRIRIDRCGNIFGVDLLINPCVDEKLPVWTADEYKYEAIATIQLFYDALGIDASFVANSVTVADVGYFAHLDMYYMYLRLDYAVVSPGNVSGVHTYTYLYLPYAKGSDVKQ